MNEDLFCGTWELLSFRIERSNGTATHPMGTQVRGRLTYDGTGSMSGQIMRLDRPRLTPRPGGLGTPEEILAAYAGYIAYFGGYEVDPGAGLVIHHVEGCLNPDWVGSRQVRHYEFRDDLLFLRLPPPLPQRPGNPVAALTWRRRSNRPIGG